MEGDNNSSKVGIKGDSGMSEETKQDWKADLIADYANIESYKQATARNLETNSTINRLRMELESARIRLDDQEKTYLAKIDECEHVQAGIKQELMENWGIKEDKTFECAAGTATLKTTKSLHIQSKEKLVAFLELNKKLTEFIKSFEITKLRKIKDAGMLEDEIATWDEKKNVAIKIAEAEQ